MADIANIGFRADTSELEKAEAKLNAITPAAEKAEKSSSKFSKTLSTVSGSAGKMSAAASGMSSSLDKGKVTLDRVTRGVQANSAAVTQAAGAAAQHGSVSVKTTSALNAYKTEINATAAAVQSLNSATMTAISTGSQFDAHMVAYRNNLAKNRKMLMFNTHETINLSRQMADIGVTAAMGMNPLMIAMQQGTQVFDIMQTNAARTGRKITTVFRAMGAAAMAALAPILPLVIAIGAAASVVGSAFGLMTRKIRQSNSDIIGGMNLTEDQLKRVEQQGVKTGVTMGDTFSAVFQVIGQRIYGAFEGPITWVGSAWSKMMDFMTTVSAKAVEGLVGQWMGFFNVLKIAMATVGDVFVTVINKMLSFFEGAINKMVEQVNKLIRATNKLGAEIKELETISVQLNNPFEGAFEETVRSGGRNVMNAYVDGLKSGAPAVQKFFLDVQKQAITNTENRISEAAGEAALSGALGAGGPSDAEKYAQIKNNMLIDIQALRAENAALNMSAEGAAKLRMEQRLLNEALENGIVLTPKQRAEIKRLTESMSEAEGQLRRTEFMRDTRARHEEFMWQLKREQKEIGLTGAELIAFRYETDALNEARRRGITLSEVEIQGIRRAGKEYGVMSESIRKSQEAIDATRNITRDFMKDFLTDIKKGENAWDAFANAAVRAMDQITDKILDGAIDKWVDQMFKGSGGGSGGNSGGGVLDGIMNLFKNLFSGGGTAFAKGGAFTNSIVSKPTAFAYGGAFGVMGEAGPEAIMPLKRGSDGSLGVQLQGRGGSGAAPINVNVTNQYTLSGALSSEDIVALNKRAAEDTREQLRREVPGIIQTYQRDGALS